MYGLSEDEIKQLIQWIPEIEELVEKEDLSNMLSEMNWYLTSDDCMWYDEDGENWYTERGKYVQSLYDKIIDWTYEED